MDANFYINSPYTGPIQYICASYMSQSWTSVHHQDIMGEKESKVHILFRFKAHESKFGNLFKKVK